jgi:hypothetical protein
MATPAPIPDDIERLKGHGIVYRNSERLGEVDYDLMIVPPGHRRPTLEPGTPPPDRPDITGILNGALFLGEVVKDAKDADAAHGGGALTLALEDGRRFEFRVLVPDTNEIVGINWLHD